MVAPNSLETIAGMPPKMLGTIWNTSLTTLQMIITGRTGLLGGSLEWFKTSNMRTASEFSSENEEALYQKYGSNVEMLPGQLGETGADKFETLLAARANSKALTDKLGAITDQAAANAVTERLNAALAYSAESKRLQLEYKAFKQYVEDSDNDVDGVTKYKPMGLANTLQKMQSKSQTQLKDQLKLDKDRVTALFADPAFTDNVKRSIGLAPAAPDADIEHVKKSMLDAIDEAHTKALEPFNKDMKEISEKMMNAAQQAADLYFFTMLVYEHSNAAQRAKILALCKRDPGAGVIGQGDPGKMGDELRGVDLSKLEQLTTLTGITRTFTDLPPDGFKINLEIPSAWRRDYYGGDNKIRADLEFVANEIKCKGKKEITFNITQGGDKDSDSTWRMSLARDAYIAALSAGFPEDKIHIKVNGEEMKAGALFINASSKLKNALAEAKAKAERRSQFATGQAAAATASMKNQITEGRKALEAAEAAAAAAAAPAVPPRH